MQVMAQGLVGAMDLFIHPQYISSNGPGSLDLGQVAIILGVIAAFALLVMFQVWYTKLKEEQALDESRDEEMERYTGP